jgi:hypothetical protein
MFVAQHMPFAEHIVKLVDINGRRFFHTIIISNLF